MSEQASTISREAKNLHQGLKDLLKNRDPWDRDVEFHRKQLRRRYLLLLLCHPYAKESQDTENHLWMQTSYAFISIYKQRISTLDKMLQSSSRQQQAKAGHGPVEHRKLIQRFRQFLAEEEKFWMQLITRFQRTFRLTEARRGLVALGVLPADSGNPEAANGSHNHFQFPPEDDSFSRAPASPALREGRLSVLSKALIRLGDIARYRELYNESGGRPKAGHDDGGPLRKTGRPKRGGPPGGEATPRLRHYDRSEQCYELARHLLPDDGNPSNQLAILATYQKDVFNSLVHYYRALCVLHPYEMASENMETVLTKALEAWKAKRRDAVGNPDESLPPRVRIEILKDNMITLLALWRLGVEAMDTVSPNHAQLVIDDFSSLVSERHLPTDMISRFIILTQSALWKYRMLGRQEPTRSGNFPTTMVEFRMFAHVLIMHQTLLEIGVVEIEEPPPKDVTESDLAQKITATFRRTLPALRISSKWIKANFEYIMQMQIVEERTLNPPTHVVSDFWSTYARFCCVLARSFPLTELPSNAPMLEEDIDLKGFAPLKKLMGEAKPSDEGNNTACNGTSDVEEQVHPNVEQLMRIADLLADAYYLTTVKNSPISSYDTLAKLNSLANSDEQTLGRERAATIVPDKTVAALAAIRDEKVGAQINGDDDTMTEATSRTDDDPVRDAFRKALDGSDSTEDLDDEDQIVWDPRATAAPITAPVVSNSRSSPVTPVKPHTSNAHAHSPSNIQNFSSFKAPTSTSTQVTPTTARDLLDNVLGMNRSDNDGFRQSHSPNDPRLVQKPQLLFGAGLAAQPGPSIWSNSPSVDWPPQDIHNPGAAVPRGYQHPIEPPASAAMMTMQAHPPWPASPPSNFQNPQYSLPRGLPSPSFAPSHLMNTGHQRSLSTYTSLHPLNGGPLVGSPHEGYTSLMSPARTAPSFAGYAHAESPIFDTSPSFQSSQLAIRDLSNHARHLSLADKSPWPPREAYVPSPAALSPPNWSGLG